MSDAPVVLLSRSAFVSGSQCPKRLWLQVHGKTAHTAAAQPVGYDAVTEILHLARMLFPGGVPGSPNDFDPQESAAMTRELVDRGAAVIYDAALLAEGLYATVDILVRKGSQWDLVEVKRGTAVKGHYLQEIAYQYYVARRSGLAVARCFILHIHNGYVRYGPVMPESLFQRVNLTRAVRNLQSEVHAQVRALQPLLISGAAMPAIEIGPHCSSPHPCPFVGGCWGHIPSPSVFDIIHLGGERKFALYYQGVFRQEDLPDGYQLTAVQQLQVQATVSGLSYVDQARLSAWLSAIVYPLCLVDFECFQSAIPLYDGTKPYQQIPFQFSVHRTETPGGQSGHTEFLAEAGPDPRESFLVALLRATGSEGTVLAYNMAFEAGRLRELARDFPEHAPAVQALLARMRDLMEPFERKWLYVPAMQGSHSIKQVLPALVPGTHYDDLEITNGQQAAAAFEALMYTDDPAEKLRIRLALLA